jgi:hypothetical protein
MEWELYNPPSLPPSLHKLIGILSKLARVTFVSVQASPEIRHVASKNLHFGTKVLTLHIALPHQLRHQQFDHENLNKPKIQPVASLVTVVLETSKDVTCCKSASQQPPC